MHFQKKYDIILKLSSRRPVGQAVKTLASHAGNMGSIPVRVTKHNKSERFVYQKNARICFLFQQFVFKICRAHFLDCALFLHTFFTFDINISVIILKTQIKTDVTHIKQKNFPPSSQVKNIASPTVPRGLPHRRLCHRDRP